MQQVTDRNQQPLNVGDKVRIIENDRVCGDEGFVAPDERKTKDGQVRVQSQPGDDWDWAGWFWPREIELMESACSK